MIYQAQDALTEVERDMLASIDDVAKLKNVESKLQSLGASMKHQVAQGAFTNEQLCLFDKQVASIKNIALFFRALDRSRSNSIQSVQIEARNILSHEVPLSIDGSGVRGKVSKDQTVSAFSSIQETLNSKILRRWFLDKVANPFPDRKTKEELIAKTNALVEAASPGKKSTGKHYPNSKSLNGQPIDYTQCSLWFVNSRRRSRWTDFFREFAHQDKVKMRRLIECLKREEGVDSPGKNRELEALLRWGFFKRESDSEGSTTPEAEEDEMATRVKECRETYATVMDWINQVSREKVGDWMDEVIREAKMQVKEEKAERREELKRRAEEIEKMHEERSHRRRRTVETRQTLRSAENNIRQMDRTLRRRVSQRKERADHRRVPAGFHTPDTTVKPMQCKDSSAGDNSIGSISWTSSGSSQYASSLFERNVQPSSSSSSSLASYDAFVRVPASPTLSILRNSQPQVTSQEAMKPVKIEVQTPMTNAASLYTSDLEPQHRLDAMSNSRTRLRSASPAPLHLQTALSGGAQSLTSRKVSQSSSAPCSASPFSPWNAC